EFPRAFRPVANFEPRRAHSAVDKDFRHHNAVCPRAARPHIIDTGLSGLLAQSERRFRVLRIVPPQPGTGHSPRGEKQMDFNKLWANFLDTVQNHYVDFNGRVDRAQFWYY